jgi:methionyl-tRNA formyltransferase
MKIIFAGTPAFAAAALDALIQADHQIAAVLTQPDRPAGRGMKTAASAVKLLAQCHRLPVLQPQTLKTPEIQAQLSEFHADVMVVAAYGLILPQAVLSIPRLGCLNIHASLLPRWRGAAPIQRAILSGDRETGITIMQMDAGLDTGDMLLKQSLAIAADDTTLSLHDKLSSLGARSIVQALELLPQGKLTAIKQDEKQACYAAKITKTEAEIDWRQSAAHIDRTVRAFNPSPGAYTQYRHLTLKIWQAAIATGKAGKAGEIVAVDRDGITVACSEGALRIATIQKPGGKKLSISDFLTGNPLQPGELFTAASDSMPAHD